MGILQQLTAGNPNPGGPSNPKAPDLSYAFSNTSTHSLR